MMKYIHILRPGQIQGTQKNAPQFGNLRTGHIWSNLVTGSTSGVVSHRQIAERLCFTRSRSANSGTPVNLQLWCNARQERTLACTL